MNNKTQVRYLGEVAGLTLSPYESVLHILNKSHIIKITQLLSNLVSRQINMLLLSITFETGKQSSSVGFSLQINSVLGIVILHHIKTLLLFM